MYKFKPINKRPKKINNVEYKETQNLIICDTKVIANIELDRLQIFLDFKPGLIKKNQLKKNGWKRSTVNKNWERRLTTAAIDSCKNILSKWQKEETVKQQI